MVRSRALAEVGGGDGVDRCAADGDELRRLVGRLGNERHVSGSGVVAVVGGAVCVDKMAARAAQFRGKLVHPFHERGDRPGYMDGDGVARVVAGGQQGAVEQLFHGHGLPHLEIDAAAVLNEVGGHLLGEGDHIRHIDLPGSNGPKGHQSGEDLGGAGGIDGRVASFS